MSFDRREILAASVAAAALACSKRVEQTRAADSKLGIPGPYPGRVVAVSHPGSIIDNQFQAEPIEQMLDRAMLELTHAGSVEEAWREFFEPGDVVGLKLNPVGRPAVISSPEMVRAIIARLERIGIPHKDVIAYDRYGREFEQAGFTDWLPEGVRWTCGSKANPKIQLDMDGYEPDVYMEMPLIHPAYLTDYKIDDPHLRRSYVAKWVTRDVNKIINLCLLKHHQSAGVTMALKNMSHGFVNNVSRSHVTTTANACGLFIPAAVDLPVIRQKVVLNVLDGIKAAYHGGPGTTVEHYTWEHRTVYVGTDPVAMDKTGWKEIDKKRVEVGRDPIALMKPDQHSAWLNGQVEHIELSANFGLGEFDDEKIRVKRVALS